ncbi:MAG: hypothetical protein WD097_07795 [Balneolales bacterium]
MKFYMFNENRINLEMIEWYRPGSDKYINISLNANDEVFTIQFKDEKERDEALSELDKITGLGGKGGSLGPEIANV